MAMTYKWAFQTLFFNVSVLLNSVSFVVSCLCFSWQYFSSNIYCTCAGSVFWTQIDGIKLEG